MSKFTAAAFAAGGLILGAAAASVAQSAFEKKTYNYADWTKGRFSEVVTVTGPAKMIFLAGIGAEEEGAKLGEIRHVGDFAGQCRYAYEKIKKALDKHGATLADVVKITSYVTDIRNQPEYGKCRAEQFSGAPLPAHTFVNITQLAWAPMMVEVDVTAMVPMR